MAKKSDGKIVHIGAATDSTFSFTPVQLLQSVIDELEEGTIPAKKVLVLLLDDESENGVFDVYSRMAQLRHSDCVAVMQYAIYMMLNSMFEGSR